MTIAAKAQILVGVDPQDFSLPAIAYDCEGNIIAQDIQAIIPGDYRSKEGARDAARYGKAARDAVKAAKKYGDLAGEAMNKKADLAYANSAPNEPDRPSSNVIEPRFNAPLKPRPSAKAAGMTDAQIAHLDRFLEMPEAVSN